MASLPSFTNREFRRRISIQVNNNNFAVRLVTVLVVLAASLLAGVFISARIYLFVGAILGAALFFYLNVSAPLAMFGIFLFASMYVRTPYALGPLSSLSMSALIVALMSVFWFVEMIVVRRQVMLHAARANFAALAIAAITVLALLAGFLPWFPIEGADLDAQLAGTGIFVFSVFIFLLGGHKITRTEQLRTLTFLYVGLGSLFLIGATFPSVLGFFEAHFLSGARGSMMWNWMAAITFSQSLANKELSTRWRLILFGISALIFWSLIAITREWVSGWGPAMATVGIIIWFYFKRLRLPIIILGGLGALLFVQTPLWDSLLSENAYSLLTRGQAYTILFEIVKVNPVLGLGPSNYYWYTPLFPILGWYVSFNSHNQYIDIIAQTGLLGFFAILWFLIEVFFMARRAIKQLPQGFEQAYAYGVLGGVVGMAASGLLGDWFLPFVYNVGMVGTSASLPGFFFMGGLVALVMINRRGAAEAGSSSTPNPDPDGSIHPHR